MYLNLKKLNLCTSNTGTALQMQERVCDLNCKPFLTCLFLSKQLVISMRIMQKR